MRRLLLLICLLLVVGCASKPASTPPSDPPIPTAPQFVPPEVAPAPEMPAPPAEARLGSLQRPVGRDQVRDELVRWMNDAPGTPQEKLNLLNVSLQLGYRGDELSWLEADLDGNGQTEFILARAVLDDGDKRIVSGGALFVLYRQGEKWAVDRTDPMEKMMEYELMRPVLHAVADLTGSGRPQVVWSRPEGIATGPQPHFVFVTAWEPGRFTHLPGQMALSGMRLKLEGRDLVLEGITRYNTYLPVIGRIDRYRYVDGAFRLVDRRFNEHPEDGYSRFWDGLVAEDSHRLADAETAYRQVLDPSMSAHSGTILGYKEAPRELTPADMQRFGEALRAFARFRLGALLLQEGRGDEAAAAWAAGTGVYQGLFAAIRQSPDRATACQAAQNWAAATPDFLTALNIGVGTSPWTAEWMCSHIDIEDHGFWERYRGNS